MDFKTNMEYLRNHPEISLGEDDAEEKRPYTMDDYREDFGGLLAEEAEENARLNSWQVVDFDA